MADDYLNDGWTANRAIEILKAARARTSRSSWPSASSSRTCRSSPRRSTGTCTTRRSCPSPSRPTRRRTPRSSPRSSAASCGPTTTSRRPARSRRRRPASWSTATTPPSATWTPRSAGCWTRSKEQGFADNTVVDPLGRPRLAPGRPRHVVQAHQLRAGDAGRPADERAGPEGRRARRPTPWSSSWTSTRRWPRCAGCRSPRAWRGTASPRCWTTRRGRGRRPRSASTRAAARTPAR